VKKIKIKSAYQTKIGKLAEDYTTIAAMAVRGILKDNDPAAITDVYFSSFAPDKLCGLSSPLDSVAAELKLLSPHLAARFHGPYKTGGEALFICLTESGSKKGDILVLGCEKMTHIDAKTSSEMLADTVNPHDRAYGATLPALGALVTRAYMNRYSVPYSAFHEIASKNHANACLNPQVQFHKSVSPAEVAASPMVADPLRRFHCAPISDGAAALLLGRTGDGINICSWEKGVDTPLFHERPNPGRFRATGAAAGRALRETRLTLSDIDVVEIHDAFSPFELINLEEMGFYPLGFSWRALAEGELEINGVKAVNPSGGLKGRGHPIGACGLSSAVEVFCQLTGSAGKRQHRGAKAAVIQSAGGVSRYSYVFTLAQ